MKPWRKILLFAFLEICLLVIPWRVAGAENRIHYVVSLANPEKHLVQIGVEIPAGQPERELQLPVWNALYQVRDFSQFMNSIRAEDPSGRPLPLVQLNKSRWKVTGAENGARVQYEMFSDDPGPYGAQLDPRHAFFNLAEILCYVEGERNDPDEVEFRNLPAGWKIATPLDEQGNLFVASDYDRMVDSPVEMGTFNEKDFETPSAKYRVIVDANNAPAVLEKLAPVIHRIVDAETAWMNDTPFQHYMFIYHFPDSEGGGGMEHSYGTAITLPLRVLSSNFDLVAGITAHEFFHLWNVKRIRPQSLEPVDYTKENYTTALWFSEGVDSTVAEYIQLRAGLVDERHYLDHLSGEITSFEMRPAHLTQSAEQSSIDAWLEKYPYYNLPVRSTSYYNKGELLGVLLDLKMREASDDRVSLEDLFRWMNQHYAKQGKFFADSAGVRDTAEALTHVDLHDFFAKYVGGVTEIPWDTFFSYVGLQVTNTEGVLADPGFEAERSFDQPPTVVQVDPGSEADHAGLKSADEILQINGQDVGRDFERRIAELAPGTLLRVRISRDGVERELKWKLGSRTQRMFRLEDVAGVSTQQKSRRHEWLFGNTAASSATAQ